VPITDPVREAQLREIIARAKEELPDARSYPGNKFPKLGIEVDAPELGEGCRVAVRFRVIRQGPDSYWEWCNDGNKGLRIIEGDEDAMMFRNSTFTVMKLKDLDLVKLENILETLGGEKPEGETSGKKYTDGLVKAIQAGLDKDDIIIWNRLQGTPGEK